MMIEPEIYLFVIFTSSPFVLQLIIGVQFLECLVGRHEPWFTAPTIVPDQPVNVPLVFVLGAINHG